MTRSDSIAIVKRFRANSLAIGDLYEEPDPNDQQFLGNSMDQPAIINNDENLTSQVVDTNVGLYILNTGPPDLVGAYSPHSRKIRI